MVVDRMTLLLMVTGYPTDYAVAGSDLFDDISIKLFDEEVYLLMSYWYIGQWR